MKKDRLQALIDRKVYLVTKLGYNYTCIIKDVDEDSCKILDKFNNDVVIDLDQIAFIEVKD